MSNPIARSVVMVPAVLLGGLFIATSLWFQDGTTSNRALALLLGLLLLAAGLLVGLLPMGPRRDTPEEKP